MDTTPAPESLYASTVGAGGSDSAETTTAFAKGWLASNVLPFLDVYVDVREHNGDGDLTLHVYLSTGTGLPDSWAQLPDDATEVATIGPLTATGRTVHRINLAETLRTGTLPRFMQLTHTNTTGAAVVYRIVYNQPPQ